MTDLQNPYEPPGKKSSTPDKHSGVLLDAYGRFVPATRWVRLAGAMVDGVLAIAVQFTCSVLLILVMYRELALPRVLFNRNLELSNVNMLASSLIALAIQGALVANRGQSLGKIVLRTRIVHSDGRVANLYDGFVRRTLPIAGIALGPKFAEVMGTPAASSRSLSLLLGLVPLIDALMIFGSSLQCGHDRFAGTFVAKVAPGKRARHNRLQRAYAGRSASRRKSRRRRAPVECRQRRGSHDRVTPTHRLHTNARWQSVRQTGVGLTAPKANADKSRRF